MIMLRTVFPCQSPEMSSVPNGIRTRAAALKARNSAFLDVFQDLLLLTETYFD
jgi:hypothetical protein